MAGNSPLVSVLGAAEDADTSSGQDSDSLSEGLGCSSLS